MTLYGPVYASLDVRNTMLISCEQLFDFSTHHQSSPAAPQDYKTTDYRLQETYNFFGIDNNYKTVK